MNRDTSFTGSGIVRPSDVSIILTTYDRAHFLPASLDSLIGQSCPAGEIILIDDGSTDDTPAVAARFGDAVRYYRRENGGKAVAVNHGLSLARGSAIWIYDDDDLAVPDALEQLCKALSHAPDAGFAYGWYDHFREGPDGRRRFRRAPPFRPPGDDLLFALLNRDIFMFQPAMLFRKACFDEKGLFDTELPRAQDFDMLLRLTRTIRAVPMPRILFHQRQHEGPRGPASNRIDGRFVWRHQVTYDRLVMEKAKRMLPLAAYLPGLSDASRLPDAALDDRQRFYAHLRRVSVNARRGFPEDARQDLYDALAAGRRARIDSLSPELSALLTHIFEGATPDDLTHPLVAAARGARAHPLGRAIACALAMPFLKAMTKAAACGRPGQARAFARTYFHLTRGDALGRDLRDLLAWAGERTVAYLRPPRLHG